MKKKNAVHSIYVEPVFILHKQCLIIERNDGYYYICSVTTTGCVLILYIACENLNIKMFSIVSLSISLSN